MKLDKFIEFIVPYSAHTLEIMGICIILISALQAFYKYMTRLRNPNKNFIKMQYAESLILALDFKLSSEIIKTVTIREKNELFILGAVVILRVVLTMVLQWEIKTTTEQSKNKGSSSGA